MSLSKHLNFNCETKVTVSESASIILLISKISFFILEIKPFLFKFAHLSQPRDKEKGHAELRGEQKTKQKYMNIVWVGGLHPRLDLVNVVVRWIKSKI